MEGIQIATQNAPDLILLDVMMPHMDGYEVCRRLKAERRTGSIPIMFVTGLGDICSETKGLELGAVDYITKPINVTAVRARVNIQIQFKWALDRLVQAAALEKALRGATHEKVKDGSGSSRVACTITSMHPGDR